MDSWKIWSLVLCLLCGVPASAQERRAEGGVITLVSRGVGKSTAEATRDACRSAVESAFGGVISAETRLQNESVFEKIVMAVAGSLETYSVLEEQVDGDWVRVKIRADVSRNLVLTQVADFQEAVVEAPGASIAAKARSKREGREAASKLVADQIRNWPSRLIRVEIEGEPEYVKSAGESVAVGVRVAISFDFEEWNGVRDGISAALRVVASKEFLNRSFESADETQHGFQAAFRAESELHSIAQFSGPGNFSVELRSAGRNLASYFGATHDRQAGWSVVAIASRAAQQGDFNSYVIPTSILGALLDAATADSPKIVVSYEDGQGVTVSRTELDLGISILKYDTGDGGYSTFHPLFARPSSAHGMQKLKGEEGDWWILSDPRTRPQRSYFRGFQNQPVSYAFVDPALTVSSDRFEFRLTGGKFVVPIAMVVREEELQRVSLARAKIVIQSQ